MEIPCFTNQQILTAGNLRGMSIFAIQVNMARDGACGLFRPSDVIDERYNQFTLCRADAGQSTLRCASPLAAIDRKGWPIFASPPRNGEAGAQFLHPLPLPGECSVWAFAAWPQGDHDRYSVQWRALGVDVVCPMRAAHEIPNAQGVLKLGVFDAGRQRFDLDAECLTLCAAPELAAEFKEFQDSCRRCRGTGDANLEICCARLAAWPPEADARLCRAEAAAWGVAAENTGNPPSGPIRSGPVRNTTLAWREWLSGATEWLENHLAPPVENPVRQRLTAAFLTREDAYREYIPALHEGFRFEDNPPAGTVVHFSGDFGIRVREGERWRAVDMVYRTIEPRPLFIVPEMRAAEMRHLEIWADR